MATTTAELARPQTRPATRFPFFEFGDFFRWPEGFWASFSELPMRIEQFVENGTMVVRAELPGVDPDKDIEIFVTDGVLQIHAERRKEAKTEAKGGYHSEMHYGAYSRNVRLPEGASATQVIASYKDGILEVRVPIAKAPAKPVHIPVKHS